MQKVIDLDGNIQSWSLTGTVSHGRIQNKSEPHKAARSLIKTLYPTLQILEEIPIPLRKSETLYLDFYLPLIKKCIEVHGEQHYKFVPFYHQNIMGWAKQKKRDLEKKEWCFNNGIKYIELPHNENIEEWTKRLYDEQ
jgi:hypothetical protein